MKLYIKYDINAACKKILQEQLDKLQLNYSLPGFGEVEINEPLSRAKLKQLSTALNNYGIQIVENHKTILVQKIKDAIREMIYVEERLPALKNSSWLADKLNHRYNSLAYLFSEVTCTSIENFIILQKIERAKELIMANELNFSKIASKLNYSSTSHFSIQFKNATGLTPTSFQRIIKKKMQHS